MVSVNADGILAGSANARCPPAFVVRCRQCGQLGLFASANGVKSAEWLAFAAVEAGVRPPGKPPILAGGCGECVRRGLVVAR